MKQLLPAALLWLSASTVLAAPNAQALATSKNCLACHAVDRKLVGPSYQDVAARYAGQKDAVSRLAEKIQKGARAAGARAHARQPGHAGRGQDPGHLGAVSQEVNPPHEKSPAVRGFLLGGLSCSAPAGPGWPGSPAWRCPG
jgi:cytochrome c551/c552